MPELKDLLEDEYLRKYYGDSLIAIANELIGMSTILRDAAFPSAAERISEMGSKVRNIGKSVLNEKA